MPSSPEMEELAAVTDDDLGSYMVPYESYVPIEFNRRLVKTNKELIRAIGDFKAASDTASARLLIATWVLVALTIAIVALTVVLVLDG